MTGLHAGLSFPPIGSVAVSCYDSRDADISAGNVKKRAHIVGGIISGRIPCTSADEVCRMVDQGSIAEVIDRITLNIAHTSGGGWTAEGGRDLRTMTANQFEVVALFTGRHTQCKSIGAGTYYADTDVGVMLVEDLKAASLPTSIPVFRTHLKLPGNTLKFDTEPMNVPALVAHAFLFGTSEELQEHPKYHAHRSLIHLGIDPKDRVHVQELADQIQLSDKGLLTHNFD